ncbi:MAG: DUF7453 family protein [Myxococcota bacterium]
MCRQGPRRHPLRRLPALVLLLVVSTAHAQTPPCFTVEVLAVTGEPAPAFGTVYDAFPSPPLVDADGRIVFEAELGGQTGLTGPRAIFRVSATGGVGLGTRETSIPSGLPPGVTVTGLALEGFVDGQILLSGELTGPGVLPATNDALFLQGWPGPYRLLADASVPGLPDTFVEQFVEPRLARGGNVAFGATLTGPAVRPGGRAAGREAAWPTYPGPRPTAASKDAAGAGGSTEGPRTQPWVLFVGRGAAAVGRAQQGPTDPTRVALQLLCDRWLRPEGPTPTARPSDAEVTFRARFAPVCRT